MDVNWGSSQSLSGIFDTLLPNFLWFDPHIRCLLQIFQSLCLADINKAINLVQDMRSFNEKTAFLWQHRMSISLYKVEISNAKSLLLKGPMSDNPCVFLIIIGPQRKSLTIQYRNIRTHLAFKRSAKENYKSQKSTHSLEDRLLVAPSKATFATSLTIKYCNIRTELASKRSGKGELQVSKSTHSLEDRLLVATSKATSATSESRETS